MAGALQDISFLENATASFGDVAENGPPSESLAFEQARVGRAKRVRAPVYNPVTHEVMNVPNIIYERYGDERMPNHAYWLGRILTKCIFGVVKVCIILKYRNQPDSTWEVTAEKAAVKIMSWRKIRDQGKAADDPQKEVAAMQHISRYRTHPNVIYPLDVLADDEYLLLFLPYCSSGELFNFVKEAGRFPEPIARHWFRQILDGLSHLQRMGVCHRDMSLENMLVDEFTRSLIIDLGMCLRVPFAAENGTRRAADVSAGTLRLLMKPQTPCGKIIYISPEIMKSKEPFDGFSIDLWGAAVMLFVMLVGLPPWGLASQDDPRYRTITRGGLARMLKSWERPVSSSAADLLQKMLMENPRQRLSLIEVRDHPWVLEETTVGGRPPPSPVEGWRK